MNQNRNSKPTDNKPLLESKPEDDATKEEWRDWALKLSKAVEKLTLEEKKRITQLRKLRKELTTKNKVFAHYKEKIEALESESPDVKWDLFLWFKELWNKK